MNFGNNLKKLRIDENLTQEELAQKINTSRSNIANYENNKNMPSIDILYKLSQLFECSIDYLLGKSETRNSEDIKSLQFANSNRLDTKGLDDDDLAELQKRIDYIKRLKGKNNGK